MNLLDQFPPKLSKADEAALAQGGPKAQEKLVLHSMREAVAYARFSSKGHIEDGELISICYDVLWRGAKRWKTGWARFFPFCKAGIRGYVNRRKEINIVKGVSQEQIVYKEAIAAKDEVHTDQGSIWDEEKEVAPEHEIDHPDFEGINIRERWAFIKPIVERCCNAREKAVLDLAYFSGRNFQEIARMLDLTRSAIQRTHRVALRKIRLELLDQNRLLPEK